MDKLHEILKGGEGMADNEKKEGKVRLDFEAWQIDSFEFEVDGESYTIEKGGTEVPADKADKLIAASRRDLARSVGANLVRV